MSDLARTEGQAYKDDPTAYLENYPVTFTGINWGSMPGTNAEKLYQMRPNQRPDVADKDQDDLFMVARDKSYSLDVDVVTDPAHVQYPGTRSLKLRIAQGGPDSGVRFLKWQAGKLTAMVLDNDATWVFTGPLQGCHIYLIALTPDQHVLAHVNANEVTDPAENERVKDDKVSAFLKVVGGHITHRLGRGDYSTADTGMGYNGFVFGHRTPGGPWQFYAYTLTLGPTGATGHRLQPLPEA